MPEHFHGRRNHAANKRNRESKDNLAQHFPIPRSQDERLFHDLAARGSSLHLSVTTAFARWKLAMKPDEVA
jgi:hypothetical protein